MPPSPGTRGQIVPVPRVELAPPSVTGSLAPTLVRRTARRQAEVLLGCYVPELRTGTLVEGTVTVTFVITAGGTVSSVAASGLGRSTIESCVAGVIRRLTFPRPREGVVRVSYLLVFGVR